MWYTPSKVGGPSDLKTPDEGVLVEIRIANLQPLDLEREVPK
jgi:hypothetical protein